MSPLMGCLSAAPACWPWLHWSRAHAYDLGICKGHY